MSENFPNTGYKAFYKDPYALVSLPMGSKKLGYYSKKLTFSRDVIAGIAMTLEYVGPAIDNEPLGDYIRTEMRVNIHDQSENCKERNGGFWTWATKSSDCVEILKCTDEFETNHLFGFGSSISGLQLGRRRCCLMCLRCKFCFNHSVKFEINV